MPLDLSDYTTWIMLLFGLGVVWLAASVALKLARAVIRFGCSLLAIAALILLVVNLL